MSNEAQERKAKIQELRNAYLGGRMDWNEAVAEIQPLLDSLNARSKEIASKYGKSFKKWTANDMLKGKGFAA